jgi:glycosyltransferase involved in cell wall biosynthesis
MKILFLDQTGKLGGAELSLLALAEAFRDRCLVAVFADGPFPAALAASQIPVQVLTGRGLKGNKAAGLISAIGSLGALVPLVMQTVKLARQYDVIYTNTQKALVVGAIAALITRRPLVYHLRDILSLEHFSAVNLWVATRLANRSAAVIANSQATREAFVAAGGRAALVRVIYNGFDVADYRAQPRQIAELRQAWGWQDKFIVGHFSRLSAWKGQHVLLEALQGCPEQFVAVFVGDALFGEADYVAQIQQQVTDLGLTDRVKFLGFRSDISALMAACDLVAHTSIAPEPFGRVIVEAMLCQTAVVATAAGGAIELVDPGRTGWLTPPGDVAALARVIQRCVADPEVMAQIAMQGYHHARQTFPLAQIQQQTDEVLLELVLPLATEGLFQRLKQLVTSVDSLPPNAP